MSHKGEEDPSYAPVSLICIKICMKITPVGIRPVVAQKFLKRDIAFSVYGEDWEK